MGLLEVNNGVIVLEHVDLVDISERLDACNELKKMETFNDIK